MFYNSYCVSSADFLQQNECETDSLNEGTIKVPVMLLVLLFFFLVVIIKMRHPRSIDLYEIINLKK